MIVELLLKKGQYKADLDAAVTDTKAATSKIQANAQGIADATQDVLSGQMDMAAGATRALAVLGPMGAAAAAVAVTAAMAYREASQEQNAYHRALILTGNASAVTSGQMNDMAASIDKVVGTQAQAAAALAAMAATGKVAGQDLEKLSLVAVEMERTFGQSVDKTVQDFAALGAEPVKASLKLNESLHYLTAATYEKIKAAEELGDKERAASIAQNALADAMRQRAAEMETHIGTMEKAWRGLRSIAKEAWDAMLNIGREKSNASQLADATSTVDRLSAQLASRQSRGLASGDLERQLAAAKALQTTMQETVRLDEKSSAVKADLARVQQAGVAAVDAVTKANEQGASKQEKMTQALADYRKNLDAVRASNPNSALLDPKQIQQTEAAIRAQYATHKAGSKAFQQEAEKEARLLAQLSGLSASFADEWETLNKLYAKGKLSLEELTKAQSVLLAKQPAVKANVEAEAKAWEKVEKANIAAAKAHESHLATLDKGLDKLQEQVRAQEEHNARIGLGKQAIAELDAAKLEEMATVQEGLAIKTLDKNLDEAQYALYKAQAAELRRRWKKKTTACWRAWTRRRMTCG